MNTKTVELSAANRLAVLSFSCEHASRMGSKVGSDEEFRAPYDVQPLALAPLAVFLLVVRVLTTRPAFHDKENRHGEELKAAQQSLHNSIKIGGDAKALRDQLQNGAAEKAAAANAILKKKGSPEDLKAFRKLLMDIADRTANAAKEGSFLGFGGERVSEGERAVIKCISQALEIAQA